MNKLKAYLAVFSAATFFLFEFINLNSFDALNETLRVFYHAGALQISNLSAMYFYANILLLIPAGLLLDRVSTRKALLWATFICIISTLLFAWSRDFTLALITRFLIGACSTLCLLSTAKLTSRWFKPHQTAFIMGLVVTIAMLGGVIAQQLNFIIAITGSWQKAMTVVAGLGVLFWIFMYCCCHDDPPGHEQDAEQDHKACKAQGFWSCFFTALKNPQTWLAGVYTNLLTIPVVVMGALWMKSYLHVVFGQSTPHADIVASMIFFGVLLGSPLAGKISDAMGKRRLPMVTGSLLTLLISLVLLFDHDLGFMVLCGLFFFMGLFTGSQVITYALVMESNPKHLTASSEALAATIIMAAGAIFQPLFGYVMEHFWDGTTHHGTAIYSAHAYQMAMWILPISFAVSTVLALFIREK